MEKKTKQYAMTCWKWDIFVLKFDLWPSRDLELKFDLNGSEFKILCDILGVRKSTTNAFVYFELGRVPFALIRKVRIFKYWIKIKNTSNCVLKACYEDMIANNDPWLVNVKQELAQIGLGHIYEQSNIDHHDSVFFKCRFQDIFQQDCTEKIKNSSKGHVYQYLVDNLCLQPYMHKPVSLTTLNTIAKIRLSAHDLSIERGRYINIARNDRKCTFCNNRDIEDEFHFYNHMRVLSRYSV